ncbi:hypothetical protein [Solibacillus sp. FSL W7-1324]|uniref:hypothetical protein n=1 Tax=Solibacillus sp. FSL W7-1324 TaxID=2921701 RepID=UPI0030FA7462
MIYLTIMYIFMTVVFISAIGGFIFYKVSYKKLSRTLSYIVGGLVSILLSFPLTKLLLFGGVWFYHLPIAVLAVVVYIAFLLFSKGNLVLIKWVVIIALTLFIAVHVYLIIATIILS